MNSRFGILIMLLIIVSHGESVNKIDQCDSCQQMKSKEDCKLFKGCTWKESANSSVCEETTIQELIVDSYCNRIASPAQNCSRTLGCAFIDGVCTNFTGCSAYIKTSTAECYNISSRCILGKNSCSDALECIEYNEKQCESLPNKYDRGCKWDTINNVCRDYYCTEADTQLNKDRDCKAFKPVCITTGAGCITSPLPPCSQLIGTEQQCLLMKGSDGNCQYDYDTYNCKAKQCYEAPMNYNSNSDCNNYKLGCVTTGKGCTNILSTCSTYRVENAIRDCSGYIGTDGLCIGNLNEVFCRARKCEDLAGTSDFICNSFKRGCISNGFSCLDILPSCSEYIDNSINGIKCNSLIGSEGKCKLGSKERCTRRVCTDAPNTLTTNEACQAYSKGCLTTGSGCVDQSTCSNTTKQNQCEFTYENLIACNWTGFCMDNTQCSAYQTKSLCLNNNYFINGQLQSCIWDNSYCRSKVCLDLTGRDYQTNYACSDALTGCVTNGTGCADPKKCSQFYGNQTECIGFTAYCTNANDYVRSNCVPRACNDSQLHYTTDIECQNYLPGCLTNGNGCISSTSSCSSYYGTPSECDKFYGYYKGVEKGAQCWNINTFSSPCIEKQCTQAFQMVRDTDCNSFLSGCLFDGKYSCLPKSAACSEYYGDYTTCQSFTGSNNTIPCFKGLNGKCKNRECSDNTVSTTDSDCNSFLSGCLTMGRGCIDSKADCSHYTGTSLSCQQFIGNGIQCTRLEACRVKVCSEKTNAISNQDCLDFHQNCRLQQGTSKCIVEQALCQGYSSFLAGATDFDKQIYCYSITISDNQTLCAYNPQTPNSCAQRTCDQWRSSFYEITSTHYITCTDYAGINSCRLGIPGDYCYAPASCASYIIPITSPTKTTQEKLFWCNNMYDNSPSPLRCTYSSGTTCKAIVQCEEVQSPTSAAACNSYLEGQCQYYNGKCFTTKTSCTMYSLSAIWSYSDYCNFLKQDNGGVVTQCKYDLATVTNCVAKTCADVSGATNQTGCDKEVVGCKYYGGVCYNLQVCTTYIAIGYSNESKRLYCQNMFDGATNDFCSYTNDAVYCAAPAATCANFDVIGQNDWDKSAFCKTYRSKNGAICDFITGSICVEPLDAAAQCSLVPGIAYENIYCDLRTTPQLCYSQSGVCKFIEQSCFNYNVEYLGSESKLYVCSQHKESTSLTYCTWTYGPNCEPGKDRCEFWNGLPTFVDNRQFCEARRDKVGNQCTYSFGSVSCRNFQCVDARNSQSQVDCDNYMAGCTYYKDTCYKLDISCATYAAYAEYNSYPVFEYNYQDKKLAYCNGLLNSFGTPCTYIKGTETCIDRGPCSLYVITSLLDYAARFAACQAISTMDAVGCTYFSGWTCQAIGPCAAYVGGNPQTILTECYAQKDVFGKRCIGVSGNTYCQSPINCESIIGASQQSDCDQYLSGCIYSTSQCYTISSTCSYSTNGINARAICNELRVSLTGDYCKAMSDSDSMCQIRICSDKQYTSHSQCQAYLSSCKSNGISCIENTTTCYNQFGISSFCNWVLDTDNVSTCTNDTPATTNSQCEAKACAQSVIWQTDPDCNTYLSGCLTKGVGCIAQIQPCSSYYGTNLICKNFTGNNIKCWGKSDTVSSSCRNRLCTDNENATTDEECNTFQTGCLTTGNGCVDSSNPCSVYKGTQNICMTFIANNKTTYCWNTLVATSATTCLNRECNQFAGTTDSDCAAYMPNFNGQVPNCVTDGKGCVPYPRTCSEFDGTEEACSKFTAIDGPCKVSNNKSVAACTPRICTEALNNLTTDILCQHYHPSCVTTGRGCVKADTVCTDIQTSMICGTKQGCAWANECKITPSACNQMIGYGSSICTNTLLQNGSHCAWNNNKCTDYQCANYDANLKTHDQCNKIDKTCTTSGQGCIVFGICSSYYSETICNFAQTTEPPKRCAWNKLLNICTQRKCKDFDGFKDSSCENYLSGCKTIGSKCIGPQYECSDFNGIPKQCLSDSDNNPCLYVDGVCYKFTECKDIISSDYQRCQQFSPYCVASLQSCISIRSCDQYSEQISCLKGINDTTCGWLPTGKCQIFNSCSEAYGTTSEECHNYNQKCVSDGIKCIDISTCSSYLTSTVCKNTGTDGECKWESALSVCKAKICEDFVAIADNQCAAHKTSTGICTTDGFKCVSRSDCTSYLTEAACTIGIDGIPCIYQFPLGHIAGTKSCRVKECLDLKGKSTEECMNIINGKKCVSNGQYCVKQDLCAYYQNKVSCQGGGSDGICAFTSDLTSTLEFAGTCQLFSSCEKANNNQITCSKNSAACQWTSKVSGSITSTSCSPKTCIQAANGSNCNPIPSFDGSKYTICGLQQDICQEIESSKLNSTQCYIKSQFTYTWNQSKGACEKCKVTKQQTQPQKEVIPDITVSSGVCLKLTISIFIFRLFME